MKDPRLRDTEFPSWRITYSDGSTFDSTMGGWQDAPDDDIQVVVYFTEDDKDRRCYDTGDDAGEGVYHFLLDRSLPTKQGRWMKPDEAHYRLLDRAIRANPPG